jgi:hypothetical protein
MSERPRKAESTFTPEELFRIPWVESKDELDGGFRRIANRIKDPTGCLVNVYRDVYSGEIVKITSQDDEEQY